MRARGRTRTDDLLFTSAPETVHPGPPRTPPSRFTSTFEVLTSGPYRPVSARGVPPVSAPLAENTAQDGLSCRGGFGRRRLRPISSRNVPGCQYPPTARRLRRRRPRASSTGSSRGHWVSGNRQPPTAGRRHTEHERANAPVEPRSARATRSPCSARSAMPAPSGSSYLRSARRQSPRFRLTRRWAPSSAHRPRLERVSGRIRTTIGGRIRLSWYLRRWSSKGGRDGGTCDVDTGRSP